jgi:hypothetical protein
MDLREFIEKNNITFEEGKRNTSIVTIIGYSQYLELCKADLLETLREEILKDSFISEEIDRLWDYCYNRKYRNWWKTELAKSLYKY